MQATIKVEIVESEKTGDNNSRYGWRDQRAIS